MSRVSRRSATTGATLAAAALFLVGAVAPAGAAPIGSSGTVNACYVAKGKSKGSLRLVKSQSACKKRRGERPLSWSIAGTNGTSGQKGQAGTPGPAGTPGEPGAPGSEGAQGPAAQIEKTLLDTIDLQTKEITTLTQQVGGLLTKVSTLEGDLGSVEGGLGSLEDALGSVEGDLGSLEGDLGSVEGALDSVEGTLSTTCGQIADATKQVNLLQGVFGDLDLSGTLLGLGSLVIGLPTMPALLDEVTCS